MDKCPVSTSHCTEGDMLPGLHVDQETQKKVCVRRVFDGKVISPVVGYNCSNSNSILTAL